MGGEGGWIRTWSRLICVLVLFGPWVATLLVAGLDEELYSRQLYVMGRSAMLRLAKSDVLVVGLSGLGVEATKNIVLAGVRSVTLYDHRPVRLADLGSQWALGENSIGKSRAAASLSKLRELNPYVKVSLWDKEDGEIGVNFPQEDPFDVNLEGYAAVLCADQDLRVQLMFSEAARRAGCCFISASSRGVFASVFCDFGEEHTTYDTDGQDPRSCLVCPTVNGEGVIKVAEGESHEFRIGDVVRFDGEDENCSHRVVDVLSKDTFEVDPPPFEHENARVTEIKQARKDRFVSLEDALTASQEKFTQLLSSSSEMTKRQRRRAITTHACFLCLDAWRRRNDGSLPTPGSGRDAALFLKMIRKCPIIAKSGDDSLDEEAARIFSRTAAGNLVGLSSAVGGIAAQEVLKACSGLFVPLKQFLYFDCMEVLPVPPPDPRDCAARGDRYDAQRAILGHAAQQQVMSLNPFVVGAGAIGCELLKCLALMGVGAKSNGAAGADAMDDNAEGNVGGITVTDMDTIEKSNLNRQFLFRSGDVGRFKSESAASAVLNMNPSLSIKALTKKVGSDTEDFFNDAFWANTGVVLTALDNIDARLYVDTCCVRYQKYLLDSGTLGAKGNTQSIIPHYSESYGSSADPEQSSIPVCTLKHFPYEVTHTIEWARDLFDGLFRLRPELAARLERIAKENKGEAALQTALTSLVRELRSQGAWSTWAAIRDLVSDVGISAPKSFVDCLEWAKHLFQELFHDGIMELLAEHPKDSLDEDGSPFWGGTSTRRVPHALYLDSSDPAHREFVWWAAFLRAKNYGIVIPHELPYDRVSSGPDSGTFPKSHVSEKSSPEVVEAALSRELKALHRNLSLAGGQQEGIPSALSFEKDDDGNGHIDFVTAASNLRAANYGIPPADRLETKRVAGKIIPAIATSTSVVAGLVAVEMIKVALASPPSNFRNTFVNLAEPFLAASEPAPAEPLSDDSRFTLWDRIVVGGAAKLSVRGLEAILRKEVGCRTLKVSSVTMGDWMLFCNDFTFGFKSSSDAERTPLIQLAAEATAEGESEGDDTDDADFDEEGEMSEGLRMKISDHEKALLGVGYIDVEVLAEDADTGNDVILPPVRLSFASKAQSEESGSGIGNLLSRAKDGLLEIIQQ